ncbi:MAG TPA: hypothetical protein VLV84_04170 [Candidatus Acidoferrales bacterium]|nr:hypothetical protein [Candidatus Acidoferrales bacterium]
MNIIRFLSDRTRSLKDSMTLAERTQSGTFVHLRIVGFSNIQTCFGMELVYRLLSQGANEGVTQRKKVGKLVLIQFWNGGAARI